MKNLATLMVLRYFRCRKGILLRCDPSEPHCRTISMWTGAHIVWGWFLWFGLQLMLRHKIIFTTAVGFQLCGNSLGKVLSCLNISWPRAQTKVHKEMAFPAWLACTEPWPQPPTSTLGMNRAPVVPNLACALMWIDPKMLTPLQYHTVSMPMDSELDVPQSHMAVICKESTCFEATQFKFLRWVSRVLSKIRITEKLHKTYDPLAQHLAPATTLSLHAVMIHGVALISRFLAHGDQQIKTAHWIDLFVLSESSKYILESVMRLYWQYKLTCTTWETAFLPLTPR